MNKKCLAASLLALTLALVACKDNDATDYTHMGQDGGAGGLPDNNADKINPDGISETQRPPGDPSKYDYTTLASDTVYFAFDSSTVPAAERAKLNEVATWFKNNPGHSLFLAGHADVRGTPEYNRALGERRALAVREYLAGLGLPATSLFTNSYGSDRPAVQGDTEEAYARNRRVEIGVIVQP